MVAAKQVFERVRYAAVLAKNHGWAAQLIQRVVRGFMARVYCRYMKYRRPLAAAKIQGMLRIVWARRLVAVRPRARAMSCAAYALALTGSVPVSCSGGVTNSKSGGLVSGSGSGWVRPCPGRRSSTSRTGPRTSSCSICRSL